MDGNEKFLFDWNWLAPSGLSTKDYIAPSSFEFKETHVFRMGKELGAVSFLQILAPELNDRLLAEFLDMESNLIVTMHISPSTRTRLSRPSSEKSPIWIP